VAGTARRVMLDDQLNFIELCRQCHTPPTPLTAPCRVYYGNTIPVPFELALRPHQPNACTGEWLYDAHLFVRATLERMNAHWHTLLSHVAQTPYQRLALVQILSLSERRAVFLTWNSAPAMPTPTVNAHLSRHLPLRLALQHGAHSLSYAELNQRAYVLAAYLTQHNAGTRIGVYVDEVQDYVSACLGILISGRTCVPLGMATTPQALMRHAVDMILTTRASASLYPNSVILQDINIDTPVSPPSYSMPAAVAWMCEHSAFSYRAVEKQLAWQYTDTPYRSLLYAPPERSIFLEQLLCAWACGDTLVYAAPDLSPAALLEFLRQQQIEKIFLPPQQLQALAQQALQEQSWPHDLRLIISYQCSATTALLALFKALPECALQHRCIPAGALTACVHKMMPAQSWSWRIPMGKALPDTRIYILDAYHQPQPIGVSGELYLAGSCVGEGNQAKLERLALHREQLVIMQENQNPLLTETCMLLNCLRTGLYAHYRDDGSIVLSDDQALSDNNAVFLQNFE
jgi:surfactin family lipopeptide synthetase A